MSDAELTEFLANATRLPEFKKEEIRQAAGQDRNNIYMEARIFMTDELWDRFSGIDTQLNKALVDFTVGKEAQDRQMTREAFQILNGLDASVKDVERVVQKRLHYEQA